MDKLKVINKYLQIGEIFISDKPIQVYTDLGSCISFVFHSKKHNLTGICHAQLPENYKTVYNCKDSCPKDCYRDFNPENEFRFISCCFKYLIANFEDRNIPIKEIDVQLFGGANLSNDNYFRIGEKNIKMAYHLLKQNKLKIINENTGGFLSRRIYVIMNTGEVIVEIVKSTL